eukprot:283521-Prorocentrum_minimum.AAC.3
MNRSPLRISAIGSRGGVRSYCMRSLPEALNSRPLSQFVSRPMLSSPRSRTSKTNTGTRDSAPLLSKRSLMWCVARSSWCVAPEENTSEYSAPSTWIDSIPRSRSDAGRPSMELRAYILQHSYGTTKLLLPIDDVTTLGMTALADGTA